MCIVCVCVCGGGGGGINRSNPTPTKKRKNRDLNHTKMHFWSNLLISSPPRVFRRFKRRSFLRLNFNMFSNLHNDITSILPGQTVTNPNRHKHFSVLSWQACYTCKVVRQRLIICMNACMHTCMHMYVYYTAIAYRYLTHGAFTMANVLPRFQIHFLGFKHVFSAASKQLYEHFFLSVRLSHLFHCSHHCIIIKS